MHKNRVLILSFLYVLVLSSLGWSQDMSALEGGAFIMGNNGGSNNERPAHRVILNPFKIDRHEVSNKEYEECVASGTCTPAHYSDGKCFIWSSAGLQKSVPPSFFAAPKRPVVCVSWQQARTYCRWRGKNLPTEAQWEYAATNGGKAASSIPQISKKSARYSSGSTAPRGSYAQGYNQLSDMCGNAWEWVLDRYEADYYHYSPESNPKGPSVGRFRVIRGGGWYSTLSQLHSRNRHWFAPEAGEVSIGFRCVK